MSDCITNITNYLYDKHKHAWKHVYVVVHSVTYAQLTTFHFWLFISNQHHSRSRPEFIMWRQWVNSLPNYTSPTDTNLHTNTIVLQTFIISGFYSVGHDILPVIFHSSSVSQRHRLVITLTGGTIERSLVIQECFKSFKLTNH